MSRFSGKQCRYHCLFLCLLFNKMRGKWQKPNSYCLTPRGVQRGRGKSKLTSKHLLKDLELRIRKFWSLLRGKEELYLPAVYCTSCFEAQQCFITAGDCSILGYNVEAALLVPPHYTSEWSLPCSDTALAFADTIKLYFSNFLIKNYVFTCNIIAAYP